jgi:integrase
LLYDIAVIILDCGLRPEECYRLQWTDVADGSIKIQRGKGKGSRRTVPCTPRVQAILEMRRSAATAALAGTKDNQAPENGLDKDCANPVWVFPRDTQSGHVEGSTINGPHDKARTAANLAGVVIYDFRHTRITRWAKVLPLPVQRLAGHTSITTTMRYIHISDDDVRAAMAKEQDEAKWSQDLRGHKTGHNGDARENGPQARSVNH